MTSSEATQHEIKISAVVFREGDQFVAQGLEYDICAYGKNVTDAQRKFLRAVLSNALVCLELGKAPMEGIKAAPQKYWDMFKASDVRIEKIDQDTTPIRVPHMPAPIIRPMMRLLEREAA